MTELKRWLHDSPPDAIARLLAAAQREKAPPRVLRRTLVALGASSVTAAAAAGAAASTGIGAPLGSSLLGIVVKWGGAGLVSGTLIAGGIAGVEHLAAPRAQADAPVRRVAAAAPMNPSPELPRAGAPVAESLVEVAPSAAPSPPPARVGAPAPAPSAESGTAREVELVDAARARLRAGDGAAVLALLASYEADFAPAHFEPEVLYLRMQSSTLLGDRAGASRSAERLVARYPQSPGVRQAEELLRASVKPDAE